MTLKLVVRVIAASILGLAAAGVAAEKQEVAWPKKSTTIFVSITLPATIQEPLAVLGALAYDPPVPVERKVCPNARFCWYFIPACEPLRVYGSKARKLRLSLEDSYSAHLRLEGDFTPWIHSSKDTCISAVDPTTKPRLRFRNYALTILGPEEPKLPDKISVSVGGPFKPAGVVEIDATPPDPPAHLAGPRHQDAEDGDDTEP